MKLIYQNGKEKEVIISQKLVGIRVKTIEFTRIDFQKLLEEDDSTIRVCLNQLLRIWRVSI